MLKYFTLNLQGRQSWHLVKFLFIFFSSTTDCWRWFCSFFLILTTGFYFRFPADTPSKTAAHTCVLANKVGLSRADRQPKRRRGTWWTTWAMTCGTSCLSARKTLWKTQFQTSSSTCRSSPSDTKVANCWHPPRVDLNPTHFISILKNPLFHSGCRCKKVCPEDDCCNGLGQDQHGPSGMSAGMDRRWKTRLPVRLKFCCLFFTIIYVLVSLSGQPFLFNCHWSRCSAGVPARPGWDQDALRAAHVEQTVQQQGQVKVSVLTRVNFCIDNSVGS